MVEEWLGSMTEDQIRLPLKSFGRRGGRALSKRQQGLIENVLPKLRPPQTGAGALDPKTLFDDAQSIWLEIGFGGAEHLTGQAETRSETGLIGCEVFFEGIAKALSQIEEKALSNIRLWDEDARELVTQLTDASIDRVFILFPDPWPKTKHQKRRLIQHDFLDDLARTLKPGANFRFATDVRSYADEAFERIYNHPAFSWKATRADMWRIAPDDHIETRYQKKKLGDIAPVYFDFWRN